MTPWTCLRVLFYFFIFFSSVLGSRDVVEAMPVVCDPGRHVSSALRGAQPPEPAAATAGRHAHQGVSHQVVIHALMAAWACPCITQAEAQHAHSSDFTGSTVVPDIGLQTALYALLLCCSPSSLFAADHALLCSPPRRRPRLRSRCGRRCSSGGSHAHARSSRQVGGWVLSFIPVRACLTALHYGCRGRGALGSRP